MLPAMRNLPTLALGVLLGRSADGLLRRCGGAGLHAGGPRGPVPPHGRRVEDSRSYSLVSGHCEYRA